jgi:hypothetical protein
MSQGKCFYAGVLLAVSLGPVTAPAAVVSPGVGVSVTVSYAYTGYGGGDFVFSTSIAASGCSSGWYIKASDPGYRSAVAVVLAAQASGLQVVIYGDNSDVWSGSPSGQYCRVQAVGLSS